MQLTDIDIVGSYNLTVTPGDEGYEVRDSGLLNLA